MGQSLEGNRGCIESVDSNPNNENNKNNNINNNIYALEPSWEYMREGNGRSVKILSIPRRNSQDRYLKTKTGPYNNEHPLANSEPEVLAKPELACRPLDVELLVYSDGCNIFNKHTDFILCSKLGEFEECAHDSSLYFLSDQLNINLEDGIPIHSRRYRTRNNNNNNNNNNVPTITRLGIKATDEFQTIWLIEIPIGIINNRNLLETFTALRKRAKSFSFFQETELVMPLIGYHNSARCERDQILHQILGFVYQCYLDAPELNKITILLPSTIIYDNIKRMIDNENNIINDLKQRVYANDNQQIREEFHREYINKLADIYLRQWEEAAQAYINEAESAPPGKIQTQKLIYSLKIIIHHVTLIMDAFESQSSFGTFARVVVNSGRSIAELFLASRAKTDELARMYDMDEKLQFVRQMLRSQNTFQLLSEDIDNLLNLLVTGYAAMDAELSHYLNVVDLMFSLHRIVYLISYFSREGGLFGPLSLPHENNDDESDLDNNNNNNNNNDNDDNNNNNNDNQSNNNDDDKSSLSSDQNIQDDMQMGINNNNNNNNSDNSDQDDIDITDESDRVKPLTDPSEPKPDQSNVMTQKDEDNSS